MPGKVAHKNQSRPNSNIYSLKQTTMKFAKLAALSSIFAASASGAVTSARGNSVRSLIIFRRLLIDSAQLGYLTDRFVFCATVRGAGARSQPYYTWRRRQVALGARWRRLDPSRAERQRRQRDVLPSLSRCTQNYCGLWSYLPHGNLQQ